MSEGLVERVRAEVPAGGTSGQIAARLGADPFLVERALVTLNIEPRGTPRACPTCAADDQTVTLPRGCRGCPVAEGRRAR